MTQSHDAQFGTLRALLHGERHAASWRHLTMLIQSMYLKSPEWTVGVVVPYVHAQLEALWPMHLRVRPWAWATPEYKALASLGCDPIACYEAANPIDDRPAPMASRHIDVALGVFPPRLAMTQCIEFDVDQFNAFHWMDDRHVACMGDDEHSVVDVVSGHVRPLEWTGSSSDVHSPTRHQVITYSPSGCIYDIELDLVLPTIWSGDRVRVPVHGAGVLTWSHEDDEHWFEDFVLSAAWSPDGDYIVYVINEWIERGLEQYVLWLWHVETRQVIHRAKIDHDENIRTFRLHDGIASVISEGRMLWLSNWSTALLLPILSDAPRQQPTTALPDASPLIVERLNTARSTRLLACDARRAVWAIDGAFWIDDRKDVYTLPLYDFPDEEERCVEFGFEGTTLIVSHHSDCGDASMIMIWDLDQRRYIHSVCIDQQELEQHALVYHPHSKTFVCSTLHHHVEDNQGFYTLCLEAYAPTTDRAGLTRISDR